MFKTILLCTDGSPAANAAADYAIWFGRKLGARIQTLYVTDIRLLEGPFFADISGALGAQPYSALLPQLKQLQRDKADTILSEVARRCEKAHVASNVAHETGPLVQSLLEHERDADLIVLGQRGEHAPWLGDMLGSTVERMVRASVKPCLVTPETFREIKHILLAYDGSAESNKALSTSFALTGDLHAQLTITTVCQREHEEAASKILHQAQEQVNQRKLTVEAQLLHGNAEDEILGFADKINADLIVMGAYGHTRIRELILGSTTSHVMRKAKVPVLLARGPAKAS
jgi:nucleotide-binding universal stress UspA family protein